MALIWRTTGWRRYEVGRFTRSQCWQPSIQLLCPGRSGYKKLVGTRQCSVGKCNSVRLAKRNVSHSSAFEYRERVWPLKLGLLAIRCKYVARKFENRTIPSDPPSWSSISSRWRADWLQLRNCLEPRRWWVWVQSLRQFQWPGWVRWIPRFRARLLELWPWIRPRALRLRIRRIRLGGRLEPVVELGVWLAGVWLWLCEPVLG